MIGSGSAGEPERDAGRRFHAKASYAVMQAEWFDVTRPAQTYARVLARMGIEAAESVG